MSKKTRRKRKKARRMTKIVSSSDPRRVTILQDTDIKYPELYMSVYVSGPRHDTVGFADMFARARCSKAKNPDEADLVVFTGGPDVDPQFYGEVPHKTTSPNPTRDADDLALYQECYEKGIPMLGICRGAQFLHVMNGGKLFQDVDGHVGDHLMTDIKTKRQVRVSSVHHQLVRPNMSLLNKMEVLGTATRSTYRWLNDHFKEEGTRADIEAFFYRDTCCIGIQGHPEYRGYFSFAQWTLEVLQKYVVENPDIEIKQNYRLRGDVLALRNKSFNINDFVKVN